MAGWALGTVDTPAATDVVLEGVVAIHQITPELHQRYQVHRVVCFELPSSCCWPECVLAIIGVLLACGCLVCCLVSQLPVPMRNAELVVFSAGAGRISNTHVAHGCAG